MAAITDLTRPYKNLELHIQMYTRGAVETLSKQIMQRSLIKINLLLLFFVLSLQSVLCSWFQSQSSKSYRKIVIKGKRKNSISNTAMGVRRAVPADDRIHEEGRGRVQPDAPIPSIRKVTVGKSTNSGGRQTYGKRMSSQGRIQSHQQIWKMKSTNQSIYQGQSGYKLISQLIINFVSFVTNIEYIIISMWY